MSMLTRAGYPCSGANNGLSAMAILEASQYVDVIVSGLVMPEMDGFGLLDKVNESYPAIPLIMMTAVHDVCVKNAALDRGAFEFIWKPFEREEILGAVRRACRMRRRTRIEPGAR